jgi:hypothetical protein
VTRSPRRGKALPVPAPAGARLTPPIACCTVPLSICRALSESSFFFKELSPWRPLSDAGLLWGEEARRSRDRLERREAALQSLLSRIEDLLTPRY